MSTQHSDSDGESDSDTEDEKDEKDKSFFIVFVNHFGDVMVQRDAKNQSIPMMLKWTGGVYDITDYNEKLLYNIKEIVPTFIGWTSINNNLITNGTIVKEIAFGDNNVLVIMMMDITETTLSFVEQYICAPKQDQFVLYPDVSRAQNVDLEYTKFDFNTLTDAKMHAIKADDIERAVMTLKKKRLSIGSGAILGISAIGYGLYEFGKTNDLWTTARQIKAAADLSRSPTDPKVIERSNELLKTTDMGKLVLDTLEQKTPPIKPKQNQGTLDRKDDLEGLFGERKSTKTSRRRSKPPPPTVPKPGEQKSTKNRHRSTSAVPKRGLHHEEFRGGFGTSLPKNTMEKRSGFTGDFF
jgi:hypothetical protein